MKRTNLFFFIWVMIFLPITAQAEDLPTIPESIWEIRSQGIAVAVLLSNHNENGFRRDAIKVYIKNTSARKIELGGGGRDWGIQVFYQNASGQKSILHESDQDVVRKRDLPDILKPGDIILRTIDLTPDELLKVKSRFLSCVFDIRIPSKGTHYTIESTMKILPDES